MAGISAAQIKELREKTGAGILDCKTALQESDGDMEKAIEFLRKKSLAQVDKKSARIAAEGLVSSYIHGGGRIGVLLEVNCETDFVAMNPDFTAFVRDMGMQIAAARPQYVRREDFPAEIIEKEKEILLAQVQEMKKPEKVLQRIVDGRIEKYFSENCLLEQAFIKEPERRVQDVLNELIGKIGEKISIRRFVRYELGEGLEKRKDDFAAEVAAQAGISQA